MLLRTHEKMLHAHWIPWQTCQYCSSCVGSHIMLLNSHRICLKFSFRFISFVILMVTSYPMDFFLFGGCEETRHLLGALLNKCFHEKHMVHVESFNSCIFRDLQLLKH